MQGEHDPAASITEQAGFLWMVVHSDGASSAEHREFAEWVVRSPERVAAYLRAVRVQQALKSPAIKWPDTPAETLIREAKAAPPEPVPMPLAEVLPLPASRRRAVRIRTVFALAAAVVLAVGLAWLMPARPQQFHTAFGEQRSVVLEDGSHITLNSSSKIEVTLRSDSRQVQLVEGEALFDVAHDPARPFDVRAGNASVRVAGTRFDVDLRGDRTTVTVVEGLVAVSAVSQVREPALPHLTAGDRVVVTDAGTGQLQHGVDISAAIAWTQQQLVFAKRPLSEVAEEFNRYNRQRITIEGDELRKEKISGMFDSHNVASFLAFLAGIPGVQVRDDGAGGYVVTSEVPQ